MVRKLVALSLLLVLAVGSAFAEEIMGVFKKYDDGKVTVTVGDKDKTYKVSTTAEIKTKKGAFPLTKAFEKMKEGSKVTLVVENDEVTGLKRGKGKGKGKAKN